MHFFKHYLIVLTYIVISFWFMPSASLENEKQLRERCKEVLLCAGFKNVNSPNILNVNFEDKLKSQDHNLQTTLGAIMSLASYVILPYSDISTADDRNRIAKRFATAYQSFYSTEPQGQTPIDHFCVEHVNDQSEKKYFFYNMFNNKTNSYDYSAKF
ncbi:uncharacterized protein LOC111039170 [Myzus persicae]|uniref:uncharacterized protein LOC111039170 n=1 Tax=Myzus persicae TaxID=13164 RepID=UPI000B93386D|nr:uncharacterized protein LOC111039170 [Myzus persicae]